MDKREVIQKLEEISKGLEEHPDMYYSFVLNDIIGYLSDKQISIEESGEKNDSVDEISFSEILGWNERDIYKYDDMYYSLIRGKLMDSSGKNSRWKLSDLNRGSREFLFRRERESLLKLRDNAVKLIPTVYYVTDEYSFDCLMKELTTDGYRWGHSGTSPDAVCFVGPDYEFLEVDEYSKSITVASQYFVKNREYNLINYEKIQPKYYLITDLESSNGRQYLSFDTKRGKYFIGALMNIANVKQEFTDKEIEDAKKATKFVSLCEKVSIEHMQNTDI